MKLSQLKKDIGLYEALTQMRIDQVPGHNFEYAISFPEVTRTIAFGKTWKNDIPFLWIHESYCPVLAFSREEEDQFLSVLFSEARLQMHIGAAYKVAKIQ